MKQNKTLLGVLMAIVATISSCSSSTDKNIDKLKTFNTPVRETYTNQNWEKEFYPSNEGQQTADPFILRFNGYYYLYVTTAGGRCMCWTSKDMINWKKVQAQGLPEGYCFDGSAAQSPWAPEVRYFNGTFYLISSFGGGKHHIFTSTKPEGPFVDSTPTGFSVPCIDGSFFIDSDEKTYVTIASGSGIKVKRMNDSFNNFKEDKFEVIYGNTKVGRWNEGPYITKRFGKYYLTWTGVDCYAPSYRVEYNYSEGVEDKGIFDTTAFKQKGGPILLNTSEDYMGLGHSANVLGPDLDSYYVSYHTLQLLYDKNGNVTNNRRTFNLSRLSFNGSTLVGDNPTLNDNFFPARPLFEGDSANSLEKDGDYYLTKEEAKDYFSCEYNYQNVLGKFIFSFIDQDNYMYLTYEGGNLALYKKEKGKFSLLKTIELLTEFDFSKIHTVRVNYGDEKLHVYFDDIEKLANYDIKLSGGKMGYMTSYPENILYTAFSNVGNGSSDANEYQKKQSLANQYDKDVSFLEKSKLEQIDDDTKDISLHHSYDLHLFKNERATYKTFFQSNKANLSITINKSMVGKKIGVMINTGDVKEIVIPNGTYQSNNIKINLGDFDVNKGQNYISIVSLNNDTKFSRLDYVELNAPTSGKTFESKLNNYDANVYWKDHGGEQFDYYNGGLTSSPNDNAYAYVKGFERVNDGEISVDLSLLEEVVDKFNDRRAALGSLTGDSEDLQYRYGSGLVIAGRNHDYYKGGPNYECCINNLQGIYFYINDGKYIIKECNYSHTKIIKEENKRFAIGQSYNLKVARKGNEISFFIDNQLVHKYTTDNYSYCGELGLYSFFNECTYKNLIIKD